MSHELPPEPLTFRRFGAGGILVFSGAVPDALESFGLIFTNVLDNRLFQDVKSGLPNAGAIKPHLKMDCQVIFLL
jgi:hypothetical protein